MSNTPLKEYLLTYILIKLFLNIAIMLIVIKPIWFVNIAFCNSILFGTDRPKRNKNI